MHLKVVFDKTEIVKFRICINFKHSIDETNSKQPKIHTSQWILKFSRKKIWEPEKS